MQNGNGTLHQRSLERVTRAEAAGLQTRPGLERFDGCRCQIVSVVPGHLLRLGVRAQLDDPELGDRFVLIRDGTLYRPTVEFSGFDHDGRRGRAVVVLQRDRRFVADRPVPTNFVVVSASFLQLFAGVSTAQEPVAVQAFAFNLKDENPWIRPTERPSAVLRLPSFSGTSQYEVPESLLLPLSSGSSDRPSTRDGG